MSQDREHEIIANQILLKANLYQEGFVGGLECRVTSSSGEGSDSESAVPDEIACLLNNPWPTTVDDLQQYKVCSYNVLKKQEEEDRMQLVAAMEEANDEDDLPCSGIVIDNSINALVTKVPKDHMNSINPASEVGNVDDDRNDRNPGGLEGYPVYPGKDTNDGGSQEKAQEQLPIKSAMGSQVPNKGANISVAAKSDDRLGNGKSIIDDESKNDINVAPITSLTKNGSEGSSRGNNVGRPVIINNDINKPIGSIADVKKVSNDKHDIKEMSRSEDISEKKPITQVTGMNDTPIVKEIANITDETKLTNDTKVIKISKRKTRPYFVNPKYMAQDNTSTISDSSVSVKVILINDYKTEWYLYPTGELNLPIKLGTVVMEVINDTQKATIECQVAIVDNKYIIMIDREQVLSMKLSLPLTFVGKVERVNRQ